MAKPKEVQITSVADLLAHVERNCDADRMLFRGQTTDMPLLPKIGRATFRPRCGNRLRAEAALLEDLKRQALPFLDFTPVSDWDWLALAQHHGMPTRLLDWSLSPLTALWFAVERASDDGGNGVVWHFEASDDDIVDTQQDEDPFSGVRTRVFQPRHITRRIIAQNGWFTVHKWQPTSKKFIAFEKNSSYRDRLTKLVILSSSFASIRSTLDRCGVNSAALYGGIEGLCRHLDWLHTFASDES